MTKYTSLDWIILPIAWPWATRRSREPLLLILMLVKFIWLRPVISTARISITTSLGVSSPSPSVFCRTSPNALNWPDSWTDGPETGKKRCGNYPRRWSWIHEMSICFTTWPLTYEHMRQFPEMAATLDRAIAVVPDDVGTRVARGVVDLEWRADTKLMHATIAAGPRQRSRHCTEIAGIWAYLALCERDWAAAERAIAADTNACQIENIVFPRGWCEGFLARERGDNVAARNFFLAARAEGEKIVREQPNFAGALCALGMIEAALGDNDKAIEHGERAVQLVPIEKDAVDGPLLVQYLSSYLQLDRPQGSRNQATEASRDNSEHD